MHIDPKPYANQGHIDPVGSAYLAKGKERTVHSGLRASIRAVDHKIRQYIARESVTT